MSQDKNQDKKRLRKNARSWCTVAVLLPGLRAFGGSRLGGLGEHWEGPETEHVELLLEREDRSLTLLHLARQLTLSHHSTNPAGTGNRGLGSVHILRYN